MSLDTVYSITIEMAESLTAGDIQLFYDLLEQRQNLLDALSQATTTSDDKGRLLLEKVAEMDSQVEEHLINLRDESIKSLERIQLLREAASEYKLQAPRPTILKKGLVG